MSYLFPMTSNLAYFSPGYPNVWICRTSPRASLITKFRTTLNKMGPDKSSMSSYIRLFEPMVIKALKVFNLNRNILESRFKLFLLCSCTQLLAVHMFKSMSWISYANWFNFASTTVCWMPTKFSSTLSSSNSNSLKKALFRKIRLARFILNTIILINFPLTFSFFF